MINSLVREKLKGHPIYKTDKWDVENPGETHHLTLHLRHPGKTLEGISWYHG